VARVACPPSCCSGGLPAQLARGRAQAVADHDRQPDAIAPQGRVVRVEAGQQLAQPFRPFGAGGHAVIDALLFAEAVEEPGGLQQLQVPRNPRLALADDAAQLADGEFAVPQQGQQAQARGVGKPLEGPDSRLHLKALLVHIPYINKSLYNCHI